MKKPIDLNRLVGGLTPNGVSYDKEAGAVYFTFSDAEINKTVRLSSSVTIDYDANGQIVGLEIIRVTKFAKVMQHTFKEMTTNLPKNLFAVA